MKFSDEILMAYADDELDPRTRAAVDAAMAADPEIARRIEQHKALRARLRSAFDKVLEEPVPDRLLTAVRNAPENRREGNVVPLRRKPVRRWSTPQWGAIAASLVIGALLGQAWVRSAGSGPITARNGELRASGVLERALSGQLASDQTAAAPVQIGVSFRSKSGNYCRSFMLREPNSLAGLACRDDNEWHVQMLAQTAAEASGNTQYRQAASAMPRSVLEAVEEQIAGDPLDAPAEAAARNKGWAR